MTFWTNSSVLGFAGDQDPERAIVIRAQNVALVAMSEGWSGPPYDPFALADQLGVHVVARDDLYDARTLADKKGRLTIQYNPNRPRGRVRYSLAHELAHGLFPDVADRVRYRSSPHEVKADDWQLELLCNIAASELLMPAGTFPQLTDEALDIDHLMSLRKEYDVSTEALFMRVARLSAHTATIFAASREGAGELDAALRVDYWRGTRSWTAQLRRGNRIPKSSAAYECTAVGYTARGNERWPGAGNVHVEAVGVPPYPGQSLPRVIGLLRPANQVPATVPRHVEYVIGDALQPRGPGFRVLVHVVNDRTANWGGGFARALRDIYPVAQESFRVWAQADPAHLKLGSVQVADVSDDFAVATIVAQHGYGPAKGARLRYDSLQAGLAQVAGLARERKASVHMPRIGAGMAGGRWPIIQELIDGTLINENVEVTVYSRPEDDWAGSKLAGAPQESLFQ